jgi:hypothetical protein
VKIGRKLLVVLLLVGAIQILAAGAASAAPPANASPTCSTTLGIAVHGQHIVGDYVSGIGHVTLGWPPAGQVGDAIAGSGAVVPGGPGPGFHFPNGFAPGASFCLSQSQAPGAHPGLG